MPASTIPRGEADAIVGRIEEARGWSTHASNGWSVCAVGGPFRNDAPAWIRVMCEPEHLAPGETIETQIERFAAWLAGLGWAMRRESMTHPACFSLAPGPVAVMTPASPPSPPPGFTGIRSRVLAAAVDGPHHVTLAVYRFPPGDGDPPGIAIDVPYVELHETHDGARPGRVMALSALVHMAQNASDDEVWQIGGREAPGGPGADEVAGLRAALAEARATIARLNRRAQQAEAIADRCVAGRPMTGPGLGRALANYSAARLAAIAEAALDGWDRAVSLRPDTPDEREWLTWALAVLTGRENGEGRATVAGMASPHSPPPTKDLPSLLAEIETAAQEAMRLHPHALHLRSVLALCLDARRAAGCEVGPPVALPPT